MPMSVLPAGEFRMQNAECRTGNRPALFLYLETEATRRSVAGWALKAAEPQGRSSFGVIGYHHEVEWQSGRRRRADTGGQTGGLPEPRRGHCGR